MVPRDPLAEGEDLALAFHGHCICLGEDHGLARVVIGGYGKSHSPLEPKPATRQVVDITRMRGGSIEADLAFRDFTIDAMALPLKAWGDVSSSELFVDPIGGRRDTQLGKIRMVSAQALRDDPLRMLRAVSLTAKLGFSLDPYTRAAIREHSHMVTSVAGERLREVFCEILAADHAREHLALLDELGVLCAIIPELEEGKWVRQPREHAWDVFWHSLEAVGNVEWVTSQNAPPLVPWEDESEAYFNGDTGDGLCRRTLLKLGCLLHDVAKPRTKAIDKNGRTRFFGHHTMGAEMTLEIMRRLRFSAANTEAVCLMVENHLRPGQMSQGTDLPTSRAVHRFLRDVKDASLDTLYLSFADYLAARGPDLMERDWHRHATKISHILSERTRPEMAPGHPPLVNGHDLIEVFGLAPGPYIGELLEGVREAEVAGEVSCREDALVWVEQAIQHSDSEMAGRNPVLEPIGMSASRLTEG